MFVRRGLTLPLLNKSLLQRTLGGALLFKSGPSALDFVKTIFSSCCSLFHPFLSFTCFFLFFSVFFCFSVKYSTLDHLWYHSSGTTAFPIVEFFFPSGTYLGDNGPNDSAFPAGECRMNEYTPESASLADGNDGSGRGQYASIATSIAIELWDCQRSSKSACAD